MRKYSNAHLFLTVFILSTLVFIGNVYNTAVDKMHVQIKLEMNNDSTSKTRKNSSNIVSIKTSNNSYTARPVVNTTTLSPEEFYKKGLENLRLLRESVNSPAPTFYRKEWAGEYNSYKDTVLSNWKNSLNIPEKHSKFVFGICTMERENADYLNDTIHSLLSNIGDKNKVLMVILVAEEEQINANIKMKQIKIQFKQEIDEGVIQVIAPPPNYYPSWEESLRQSFGDPFERVKWRSKQNLDQILLLTYVNELDYMYYVMLEDDILASSDFLAKMEKHVDSLDKTSLLIASYCSLGAIGKLFPRHVVAPINIYIGLFWNDKPLDWLFIDYIVSRVCSIDDKDCKKRWLNVNYISYKPSLFQHMGKISSLKGKMQNLKDNSFKS